MKKIRSNRLLFQKISLCLLVSFIISACSTNELVREPSVTVAEKNTATSVLRYSGEKNSVTLISQSGKYRFTLYSKTSPIPFKKIHNWILKVESIEGVAIEKARLFVFGGMPQHRHGFPTKPRVKKYLGDGRYLVEGIKFTMPGYWEMRFNMKLKKTRDRVIFKINLR